MPAWNSFPVSVVYKPGDESPPSSTEAMYKGTLRKDMVPTADEQPKQKQSWKGGYEVAKHKALTPTGKEAWQIGRLDRDPWENKTIPTARLFAPDDHEEAEKLWVPGSGRGTAQDSAGNTRGLRGRKASSAKSMLHRNPLEDAKQDAEDRTFLSPDREAAKVFANACCDRKQGNDTKTIRTAKKSEEEAASPSTRAPSEASPVRGWDLSSSPRKSKICVGEALQRAAVTPSSKLEDKQQDHADVTFTPSADVTFTPSAEYDEQQDHANVRPASNNENTQQDDTLSSNHEEKQEDHAVDGTQAIDVDEAF